MKIFKFLGNQPRSGLPLGPTQPKTRKQPVQEQQEFCDPIFTPGKPPFGLASGLIAWSELPAKGNLHFGTGQAGHTVILFLIWQLLSPK